MKKFLMSTLWASALLFSACGGDDSRQVPGNEDPGVEEPVPGGEDPTPGGQDPDPVPGGQDPDPVPGGQDPDPVPGGEDPGTPSTQSFELRLKGESLMDFTSLKVPVSDVTITAEGKPVNVQVVSNLLELADGVHAPLAARFTVPPGIDKVQITVHFNAMGDFARQSAQASQLDARVAPITFEAKVSDLRTRGRAVLHLDVSRSIVDVSAPGASGLVETSTLLLPTGAVKF
ncbi:hypothetical protein LXT21_31100 [Myxococcus sp. K38C18041901]|uniref:hypothetical protein n=1 Tax=Myxococcus guangdongensis TaxID=2906760 RepID=UPI0020A7B43C|nr:hypothetical protein [Myxococcus guangdongensis]MCP3063234.1 hypothetical protein [Myxococcus guangdongensis]